MGTRGVLKELWTFAKTPVSTGPTAVELCPRRRWGALVGPAHTASLQGHSGPVGRLPLLTGSL